MASDGSKDLRDLLSKQNHLEGHAPSPTLNSDY
jgi:hypothetical protein